MSTVIVYSLPFSGHINPALPLVAELVQRGEQVFFYATEEFQQRIEHTGASFRSYGPFDLTGISSLDNPFKVTELYLRPFPALMKKCLPEAQELHPDYLMNDTSAPWGSLIAELLQIPSVGLQSVLLVKSEMLLYNIPQATRALRLYMTARKEARSITTILKTVANKYHTRTKSLLEAIHYDGDLTIVYSSRAFQPMEHLFKENFVFIGPSTWDRGEHLDFPLEQLGERPVVYISLGTIFNNRLDFYRTCLEAFANAPYQVVLATGSHVLPDDLGELPNNFLVYQYVPQVQILSQASVFISHAGLNSVLEALWYGVPLVMFPPKSLDQPWVAECVEKAGAGKAYRKPRITASRLRAMVESVLTNPTYARASRRIGESLRAAGGVSKAADAIEKMKRRKGISVSSVQVVADPEGQAT